MDLMTALFESAELPADFKEKTKVLFESALTEAVDAKVKAELVTIQESYDTKLAEHKEIFISEAVELIDSFLEESVVEWAKENVVPLDAQIKSQLAENFLTGIRGLLESADIALAETDAGSELHKLNEQVATLTKVVEEKSAALVEAESKIVAAKTKEIVESLTAGLADTVAHRVSKLCEAFEFVSEESFRSKAEMIIEAITGGKKIDIKGTQNADGTVIPVGEPYPVAKVSLEATDPTDPATIKINQQDDPNASITEQFEHNKNLYAPDFGTDLSASTLKLFK